METTSHRDTAIFDGAHHDTNELDGSLPPPQQAAPWSDHDRLPDGGAWLYVTDHHNQHHAGAWVPVDLDPHHVATLVTRAVGQPVAEADLVVIDQSGIETMVDEDHFAAKARQ